MPKNINKAILFLCFIILLALVFGYIKYQYTQPKEIVQQKQIIVYQEKKVDYDYSYDFTTGKSSIGESTNDDSSSIYDGYDEYDDFQEDYGDYVDYE